MTDRELLELAAKACGAEWTDYSDRTRDHWIAKRADGVWYPWDPLTDDGDALRLAVKFGIHIGNEHERCGSVTAAWGFDNSGDSRGDVREYAPEDGDDYAATRRAIVRAAAAIGEAM